MEWLIITAMVLALCFGSVLLFGAPYLPTLGPQVDVALDMVALQKGETLLELGCGDGKVLVAAAQRGLNVVGYELNPLLFIICMLRTLRYRKQVRIIWGDFFKKQWPPADAIFTFLLPKYMEKLNKKVMQSTDKPVKLVSFAFEIPSQHAAAQKDGVFLYRYS
jgi:SAM-dependent methyltransferase